MQWYCSVSGQDVGTVRWKVNWTVRWDGKIVEDEERRNSSLEWNFVLPRKENQFSLTTLTENQIREESKWKMCLALGPRSIGNFDNQWYDKNKKNIVTYIEYFLKKILLI